MADLITAKFPSKCKICSGAVAVGTKMVKLAVPGSTLARYGHEECYAAMQRGDYVWNAETESYMKKIGADTDTPVPAAPAPAAPEAAVEADEPEVMTEAPEVKEVKPSDQPAAKPRQKASVDLDAMEDRMGQVLNAHAGAVSLQIGKAVELAMAEHLADIKTRTTVIVHEWRGPNGAVFRQPAEEIVHEALEELRDIVAAGLNALMVGPTQCGKSTLGKQLAKSMGIPFYTVACSIGMSEGALMGRLLPVGENGKFEFIETGFIKAWRDGGVFLLDEMDAMPADVAIVMNDALANGVLTLMAAPGQPTVERHPDCVIVAAANTWGTGADRQYVGRQQLDFATMMRFVGGEILLDYDPRIEQAILKPVSEDMLLRLWGMRAAIRKVNKTVAGSLRREITTRHCAAAAALLRQGWKPSRVEAKLLCGWTAEERARLAAAMEQ